MKRRVLLVAFSILVLSIQPSFAQKYSGKTQQEVELERDFISKAEDIERKHENKMANFVRMKIHPDMLNLLKKQEIEWNDFLKEMNEAEFDIKMMQLQERQQLEKRIDAEKLINQRGSY